MAISKKNKPKRGMSLHKHIALGGKPKEFNGAIKTGTDKPSKK